MIQILPSFSCYFFFFNSTVNVIFVQFFSWYWEQNSFLCIQISPCIWNHGADYECEEEKRSCQISWREKIVSWKSEKKGKGCKKTKMKTGCSFIHSVQWSTWTECVTLCLIKYQGTEKTLEELNLLDCFSSPISDSLKNMVCLTRKKEKSARKCDSFCHVTWKYLNLDSGLFSFPHIFVSLSSFR